jgi:hypothetical protein
MCWAPRPCHSTLAQALSHIPTVPKQPRFIGILNLYCIIGLSKYKSEWWSTYDMKQISNGKNNVYPIFLSFATLISSTNHRENPCKLAHIFLNCRPPYLNWILGLAAIVVCIFYEVHVNPIIEAFTRLISTPSVLVEVFQHLNFVPWQVSP